MTELVPIRYDGGDGVVLTGYLADGSGGRPAAGVLVAHEGGGLGRHTKEVAHRLSKLGYLAFALNITARRIRRWSGRWRSARRFATTARFSGRGFRRAWRC
jgi:dienelactone hydrolase